MKYRVTCPVCSSEKVIVGNGEESVEYECGGCHSQLLVVFEEEFPGVFVVGESDDEDFDSD